MTGPKKTEPAAEIVPAPAPALVPASRANVVQLLEVAVREKFPLDQMRTLIELQERLEAREAAQAFRAAFAAFQGECPVIEHDQTVDYQGNNGRRVTYTHASLAEIARTVNPILARHGLSYVWESGPGDAGFMVVTCVVSHVGGHSVRASFTLPARGGTDKMSEAQQYSSSLTYGKRMALVQALGLAMGESDPDGVDLTPAGSDLISEEQAANLQALLDEIRGDRASFLRYMGAASLREIRARDFPNAISALEAKRGGR